MLVEKNFKMKMKSFNMKVMEESINFGCFSLLTKEKISLE